MNISYAGSQSVEIITFEPETLESQSKAQKTRTWAWFPMKTSAKHFGLAVGP